MAVTGHGPASSTVTRATLPSSWKTWVMPSFLARIAGIRVRSGGETDLDVDARREVVQALERVDRLGGGLVDGDQTLGRADHAVDVLLGRQRHGSRDARPGTGRRLDDLLGRGLDGRGVVCLEAYADLVLVGGCHESLSSVCFRVAVWSGRCCARCLIRPAGAIPPGPSRTASHEGSPCRNPPRRRHTLTVGLYLSYRTANVRAGWRAGTYSMISVTTPEPTVRPPSRMAKRRPWSMAIGWI